MLKFDPIFQIPQKGLYFLSLGGIGEIGANCYLSGASGKKYLDSDRFRKEGLKIEFQNLKTLNNFI